MKFKEVKEKSKTSKPAAGVQCVRHEQTQAVNVNSLDRSVSIKVRSSDQ